MTRAGAWVTLLTRESYLPGVRVLQRSLVDVGTAYPLVVMVTGDITPRVRALLRREGCRVVEVARVDLPGGSRHSYVFEHFSEVWTKLRAWCLTDYDRVVLLDADMLVVAGMDELFTMPLPDGGIAACHTCRCNVERHPDYPTDWVPERCWFTYLTGARPVPDGFTGYFNSGLVVLEPDDRVLKRLVERIAGIDPAHYPFPDQDLLNEHFAHRWAPLPWGYNALKTLLRQHPDVWDPAALRNVHFLLTKPWAEPPEPTPDPAYAELERMWHEVAARLPSLL